jgi:adenylate cyclase, class 2
MKEVEVKAKLKNKDVVMKKLTELGCVFEDPIVQNDTVYAKNVGSIEVFKANDVFLRIRIKNNSKAIFTLKKRMKNDLDALEYETGIDSKDEMEQALFLMGYQESARVNKTRIITHYNGCEICIDDVEGLGSFIEMEKLTEEGDSEEIQNELFAFFITLGIIPEDRVTVGYDILILQNKK